MSQQEATLVLKKCKLMEAESKYQQSDEATPQNFKTYKLRFWILGIFSFLAFFQCLQWNLWGPLSASVDAAFDGFGSDTVAMIANWGTITYLIFSYHLVRIMDKNGIRVAVLIIAVFVTVGTVLRAGALLINSDILFKVMCHIGAIVNGAVGPIVMISPPVIAALWFPPNERTTATGCGQLFNLLGNAGSYLQPLIVRSPKHASSEEIRSDIARLLYIYVGVSLVVLVSVAVYFPAKPPTPPSVSSTKERIDVMGSAARLVRNSDYRLTVISMVFCISVPAAWYTVLNFSLGEIGIDQDEAMGIGFLSVSCSTFFGILVTRITDMLYGHLKVSLIFLMAFDIAFFYWFFLLTWGCIEVTQWQVYVSIIFGMSLNGATIPLFTELAVEFAYPCSELVVAGFFTFGMNVIGTVFLFLFLIPNIGYDWITYTLLATSSVSIVLIVFVEENYRRTSEDKQARVKEDKQHRT
ncbi:solute carrier family 49 member 4 homolog isoform X2 [Macrobrachium rosenbergii]|uniref:solute carrier family 49 member 4 homolog isoform X2 n=1 Tax=Macrobrachium rosenbergii TaxID=79674 RepID=UPI0034D6DF5C